MESWRFAHRMNCGRVDWISNKLPISSTTSFTYYFRMFCLPLFHRFHRRADSWYYGVAIKTGGHPCKVCRLTRIHIWMIWCKFAFGKINNESASNNTTHVYFSVCEPEKQATPWKYYRHNRGISRKLGKVLCFGLPWPFVLGVPGMSSSDVMKTYFSTLDDSLLITLMGLQRDSH